MVNKYRADVSYACGHSERRHSISVIGRDALAWSAGKTLADILHLNGAPDVQAAFRLNDKPCSISEVDRQMDQYACEFVDITYDDIPF